MSTTRFTRWNVWILAALSRWRVDSSREISISKNLQIFSVAEFHVYRNLELLACETCRGHIRGARDRPNPPKGAFTAPRGGLSNLRPNEPKSTAYSHAPSRSGSARSGWRAAACEEEKPFPEPCLRHTFRFPENAEAVRANECPSRRRKTHVRASERQSLPLGCLRLLSSYSDGVNV